MKRHLAQYDPWLTWALNKKSYDVNRTKCLRHSALDKTGVAVILVDDEESIFRSHKARHWAGVLKDRSRLTGKDLHGRVVEPVARMLRISTSEQIPKRKTLQNM